MKNNTCWNYLFIQSLSICGEHPFCWPYSHFVLGTMVFPYCQSLDLGKRLMSTPPCFRGEMYDLSLGHLVYPIPLATVIHSRPTRKLVLNLNLEASTQWSVSHPYWVREDRRCLRMEPILKMLNLEMKRQRSSPRSPCLSPRSNFTWTRSSK